MRHELIGMATEAANVSLGRTMDRRGALRLMLGVGAAAVAGGAGLVFADGAEARSGDGLLRTTTALNLRAKPRLSAKVLVVMPKGAVVTNQYREKNGFIKVSYQGTVGWAHGSCLVPADGGTDPGVVIIGQAVTTTAINFRPGLSPDNSPVKILPKGAIVDVSNGTQSGFRYRRVRPGQTLSPAAAERGPL